MRTLPIAVPVVTLVLLFNMLVALLELPSWLYFSLFLLAPLLVVWMVYSVLQDRSAPMRELQGDAEWGYRDRPDIAPVE
jgi:hypothetical protein